MTSPAGPGAPDPGTPLVIPSDAGPIAVRFHAVPPGGAPARGALLCVGGFNGGFDGPALNLYADLGTTLPARGIAVLRLDFRIKRAPGPIDEATFDVVWGIDRLAAMGFARIALVGHSFGGAIVVRAGVRRPQLVAGVAALATQTAGLEEIRQLSPVPLLLIHGTADDRLTPRGSQWAYAQAGEPKHLHLLDGATHSLRQRADDVRRLLLDWLETVLPAPAPPPGDQGENEAGSA